MNPNITTSVPAILVGMGLIFMGQMLMYAGLLILIVTAVIAVLGPLLNSGQKATTKVNDWKYP